MLNGDIHIDNFTGTAEQKFNKAKKVIQHKENIIKALHKKIKGFMEANRKEKCNFDVSFKNEIWNIIACWINASTDNVCWYEGKTQRNRTIFYRTFSPDEIELPEIKEAV